MNDEATEFFKAKGKPIAKLIAGRPDGISAEQVEAAAYNTHKGLMDGTLKLKDVSLAWHVWKVAKHQSTDSLKPVKAKFSQLKKDYKDKEAIIQRLLYDKKMHIYSELTILILLAIVFGLQYFS